MAKNNTIKKTRYMKSTILSVGMLSAMLFYSACTSAPQKEATETGCANPVMWTDVPDLSMVRVGMDYYLTSTTMHMNPGVPVMKSNDLSNWKIVSYCYDTLGVMDETTLTNGKNTYGRGSWASCIRYVNNRFVVSTFDQVTAKTYFFTTNDIESGKWERHEFRPSLHDHTVVFEDDGKVYMINGNGRLSIQEIEPDFSGVKPGTERVLIENAGKPAGDDLMLNAEGSQMFKINGKYYLFNIVWPRGGMRTVVCHRSDSLFGPYEGRVVLMDQGVAQGGLVDTPDGHWFAYLFGDRGAVGRIPYWVPVEWKDGWPVLGVDGKVPDTLNLPKSKGLIPGIVDSDDFEDSKIKLVWQWNHNPVNELWSLTERSGFLRLKTGRIDTIFTQSRNMLTQRTFGPMCKGSVCVDVTNLKDGDVAGLGLLAGKFGYVGVKVSDEKKYIVMTDNQSSENGQPEIQHDVETIECQTNVVYFKAECNFKDQKDEAEFFYSFDQKEWKKIGETLKMVYRLDHFMGQRFAVFNYSTKQSGGYADFDWFKIEE